MVLPDAKDIEARLLGVFDPVHQLAQRDRCCVRNACRTGGERGGKTVDAHLHC